MTKDQSPNIQILFKTAKRGTLLQLYPALSAGGQLCSMGNRGTKKGRKACSPLIITSGSKVTPITHHSKEKQHACYIFTFSCN